MSIFGTLQPLTVNSVFPSGGGARPFLVRVLGVTGATAQVLVEGVTLEVRSEIPLARNQIFLVMQDLRDDGTITWRVLREIPASASQNPFSSLEQVLCTSLRQVGLPLTESNLQKVRQYQGLLGKFTATTALAAAFAIKLGLRSPTLIQALASFISCLLGRQDNINKKERNSKDVAPRLKELCEGLKNLFCKIREHSGQPLESLVGECFPGKEELGKLLLAGQFFARAQENSPKGGFYYIPLFLLAAEGSFPEGVVFICPGPADGTDSGSCRVRLLLDTKNLGKVQINICCWERSLQVNALVEREETKLLFDRYWSELDASLQKRKLQLYWSGCRVGKLPREKFGLRLHQSLDLFV